ncbi:hypothetical protein NC653_027064 [Populus alba x Populus x berolinensis]|uniref:Uncharacterized protein n=1 Tax=Populus alba x Populus x berolinensis TaxID=444605 RepID=A0AAD6Q6D0_9ROSI|nr:hypothetical protein NC653_027064 [Populus alba x Populus x berolinensis]
MNEPIHRKNKESFGIQTKAPYDDGASKRGGPIFQIRKILNEVQQDGGKRKKHCGGDNKESSGNTEFSNPMIENYQEAPSFPALLLSSPQRLRQVTHDNETALFTFFPSGILVLGRGDCRMESQSIPTTHRILVLVRGDCRKESQSIPTTHMILVLVRGDCRKESQSIPTTHRILVLVRGDCRKESQSSPTLHIPWGSAKGSQFSLTTQTLVMVKGDRRRDLSSVDRATPIFVLVRSLDGISGKRNQKGRSPVKIDQCECVGRSPLKTDQCESVGRSPLKIDHFDQELGARKPNSPSPQTATHLFFSSSISLQPITKTTASHQIFSLFLTEPHCPDDPLPLILFFFFPPEDLPSSGLSSSSSSGSFCSQPTDPAPLHRPGNGQGCSHRLRPTVSFSGQQQRLLPHQRCQFSPSISSTTTGRQQISSPPIAAQTRRPQKPTDDKPLSSSTTDLPSEKKKKQEQTGQEEAKSEVVSFLTGSRRLKRGRRRSRTPCCWIFLTAREIHAPPLLLLPEIKLNTVPAAEGYPSDAPVESPFCRTPKKIRARHRLAIIQIAGTGLVVVREGISTPNAPYLSHKAGLSPAAWAGLVFQPSGIDFCRWNSVQLDFWEQQQWRRIRFSSPSNLLRILLLLVRSVLVSSSSPMADQSWRRRVAYRRLASVGAVSGLLWEAMRSAAGRLLWKRSKGKTDTVDGEGAAAAGRRRKPWKLPLLEEEDRPLEGRSSGGKKKNKIRGRGSSGQFKGEEKNQKVGAVWPGKEEEVGRPNFLHNKFKAPAITATTLDGSRASRSLHRDPPVPAFRLLLFQLLSNVNATPPHQQQHCTSSDLLTDRPPPAAAKVVLPSYSSIRVSSSQEQQHQLAPAVAQSPAPQRASSLNSSVSRQLLIPPPASYQPQAW